MSLLSFGFGLGFGVGIGLILAALLEEEY